MFGCSIVPDSCGQHYFTAIRRAEGLDPIGTEILWTGPRPVRGCFEPQGEFDLGPTEARRSVTARWRPGDRDAGRGAGNALRSTSLSFGRDLWVGQGGLLRRPGRTLIVYYRRPVEARVDARRSVQPVLFTTATALLPLIPPRKQAGAAPRGAGYLFLLRRRSGVRSGDPASETTSLCEPVRARHRTPRGRFGGPERRQEQSSRPAVRLKVRALVL
jgi:hypothetical protein